MVNEVVVPLEVPLKIDVDSECNLKKNHGDNKNKMLHILKNIKIIFLAVLLFACMY